MVPGGLGRPGRRPSGGPPLHAFVGGMASWPGSRESIGEVVKYFALSIKSLNLFFAFSFQEVYRKCHCTSPPHQRGGSREPAVHLDYEIDLCAAAGTGQKWIARAAGTRPYRLGSLLGSQAASQPA